METVELKFTSRYTDYLNRATLSEGVECVFRFTKKCFRVDPDDLNHIPMEILGSKPLIIHLGFAKEI